MSAQAKNFTQLPNGFLFESKLTPQGKKLKLNGTQKFMMICLEAYMKRQGTKEVQISLKQFASWMNSDVKTVSNNQKKLEAMGLIVTRSPYKEDGSQETTYWMLIEQFEFEVKEAEQEKQQESDLDPIGKIPVPPTEKNPIPYGKNSDRVLEKTESKDNTLLNNPLNTINNTSDINKTDIEAEIRELTYECFGSKANKERYDITIQIYKLFSKNPNFSKTLFEGVLLSVYEKLDTIDNYKNYLSSSVKKAINDSIIGVDSNKPNKQEKRPTSPKKVVRKEIAPKWLDKQKENDEKYKKENEEAESDPTWLEIKAKMKAELMQLDQDLKQGVQN